MGQLYDTETSIKEELEKQPKRSWRKEIQIGEITKCLSVKEVENGFVIDVSRYGSEGEGEKRKYIDERKTFISTDNPLEDSYELKDNEKDKKSDVKSLVKSALDSLGGINV